MKTTALHIRAKSNGTRAVAARRDGAFNPGFTLIEMLVVILIIGILAASAMGVGNRVRMMAWKTRARDTTRQVSFAWVSYLRDNRRFPVAGINNAPVPITSMTPANCVLLNKTQTYLETSKDEVARNADGSLDSANSSGVLDPWGWRAWKSGDRSLATRRQIQTSLDNGAGNDKGQAYDGKVNDNQGVEVRAISLAWSWGVKLTDPRDDIVAR